MIIHAEYTLFCNSSQYIHVMDLHNFSFVLQNLTDRINSRNFSEELASYWLLLYSTLLYSTLLYSTLLYSGVTLRHKISFPNENKQPSLQWRCIYF